MYRQFITLLLLYLAGVACTPLLAEAGDAIMRQSVFLLAEDGLDTELMIQVEDPSDFGPDFLPDWGGDCPTGGHLLFGVSAEARNMPLPTPRALSRPLFLLFHTFLFYD